MSCNGCRVLRKGCSETCILRPCLQWIQSAESQGHATVFVAKFFGRAGLMSFISAVPEPNRPALFQSLLFEACGRTVNPVNGAVGMLWTGKWHLCQAAVETVLRGGTLRPILDLNESPSLFSFKDSSKTFTKAEVQESPVNHKRLKSERSGSNLEHKLNHGLVPTGSVVPVSLLHLRPGSPSEESVTTSCWENGMNGDDKFSNKSEKKLLNLFV